MKIAFAARARARAGRPEEITEAEFLALDALMERDTLTVGEIQRRIGVLPAQMSRIVRSLEGKAADGFVKCTINPDDRRRIDVSITARGRKAHQSYQSTRLEFVSNILTDLSPDDRRQFMRVVRTIRTGIDGRLASAGA
ncbi:MAG: MarR family transcriptional regulator [Phycisphaerales bacterium]|nr:MarR family transcriptional regulator [Phycisphaerales bacterium]